jgi:hypothetical protein
VTPDAGFAESGYSGLGIKKARAEWRANDWREKRGEPLFWRSAAQKCASIFMEGAKGDTKGDQIKSRCHIKMPKKSGAFCRPRRRLLHFFEKPVVVTAGYNSTKLPAF